MSDQLAEVEHRLHGIDQFSSVVAAIRGMAAVRLKEAQERLEGIAAYAETVATAIGEALVLLPSDDASLAERDTGGAHLMIALCSEQGFVGAYNGRVLDAVEEAQGSKAGASVLFVVGARGAQEADERSFPVEQTLPMAGHADEVMTQANRLAGALYRRLGKGGIGQVTLVHATPGKEGHDIAAKPLIPFDFNRFPPAAPGQPPLLNLPVCDLLNALAEEYVFAEICEALMHAYAAENEARMYAMLAARSNIDRRQEELTNLARRLRQENITSEVVELAIGAAVPT